MNDEKKRIEKWVLAAARAAGVPIPTGEIPGEEPDFRFETETGPLGIEVTELLRPASSNGSFVPVEEESLHKELIQMAQEQYYNAPGAKPARLVVYFANARGKKRNKREMASALVEFVKANIHRANPAVALSSTEVPEGFGAMSIASEPGDWWCGECGGVTISEIPEQLASRISAKNKRLPTYRANLPKGASVWLLIYSGVAVSRGVPLYGIDEWKFPFDFDRLFWFDSLQNRFAEIQRAECAVGNTG